MKEFLLSIFSFLTFSTAMMAEGKNLVITFDDGTTQTYLLANEPAVSVGNDRLTVAMSGATTEYTLNTVKTFTFAEATGIIGVQANADTQIQGDRLLVSGADKAEAYTTGGRQIPVDYIKTSNGVAVNLGSLPKGVSIVKVNGKSLKFTRK